ncbi:MAG: preprotein translocase subunit YajC [Oscillospiraceae bacterium]|jgi:preprotein translocase subunit YajC|nr:preprotein translocase subunit YajC [Oscillospiraceae bacterium]
MNQLLLLTESVAPAATDAAAAAAEQGGVAAMLVQFVPLVLIFVVFYFLLIRPQRKKDKAAKDMLKRLSVGDRVCTIGGIYGTIDSIKDDVLTLAVGQDKVKLVFARWGIRNVEESSISNDTEALV